MGEKDHEFHLAQGLFLAAANSVIWRLATGSNTDQNSPSVRRLTAMAKAFFKAMDPASVFVMLQLKSVAFCR